MSDDATLKAQATARFNTMAAEFGAQGAFAHFGRRLVEVVGVEAGHRVLDVATGRGAVFFAAAERAGATGEAIGVDLAENMVRAANEEAEWACPPGRRRRPRTSRRSWGSWVSLRPTAAGAWLDHRSSCSRGRA